MKMEDVQDPVALDDPALLYSQIKECLVHSDAKGLTTYVLEQNLSQQAIFFDLASDIVHCLTQENLDRNPSFFEACERCLNYLIKTGKPRIMLLAVLENWGDLADDTQFKSVLGPIRDCLLAFPKPCMSSLENSLQAIYRYISQLELPEDNALEGEEENKLFDNDPVVRRIADVVLATLDFMQPFVEAVSVKNVKNRRNALPLQAGLLGKYLLLLLHRPVIFLNLSAKTEGKASWSKTESRMCAETLISHLACVHQNLHQLVDDCLLYNNNLEQDKNKRKANNNKDNNEYSDNKNKEKEKGLNENKEMKGKESDEEEEEDEEDEALPIAESSISCLLYLIFIEHLSVDSVPWVYSSKYMLEYNIPFALSMLESTKSQVLYKGLHLASSCLEKVEPRTLPAVCFDNDCYLRLLTNLIKVMLHCHLKSYRQLAVSLFTDIIHKFQPPGRYRAYESLLATCDNPGVIGYCIQLLKDELDDSLQSDPIQDRTFLGKSLMKLLRIILHLPNAETTDILQHSDRIITSMNFLRYLVLRDPRNKNITGFWTLENEVKTRYLSQLQVAIDMSKAHYRLELNNIQNGEESKKIAMEENNPEITVSVGSEIVPGLPAEQQVQVLYNALNTFDIMESLLCRINEIFDQQPKNSRAAHSSTKIGS